MKKKSPVKVLIVSIITLTLSIWGLQFDLNQAESNPPVYSAYDGIYYGDLRLVEEGETTNPIADIILEITLTASFLGILYAGALFAEKRKPANVTA